MKVNEAIFSITAKSGLIFSVFIHKIVFGYTKDNCFEEKCFVIDLNKICEVFCAFFQIVKNYTQKKKSKGVLCKLSNTVQYHWELAIQNESTIITLTSIMNDSNDSNFELNLSILEFNDCVLILSNLILTARNLAEKEVQVFSKILNMELDQILKFKNEKMIFTFLKMHEKDFLLSSIETHNVSLLIQYHLDILVAINTMKSLYNAHLSTTQSNIDVMLSCN